MNMGKIRLENGIHTMYNLRKLQVTSHTKGLRPSVRSRQRTAGGQAFCGQKLDYANFCPHFADCKMEKAASWPPPVLRRPGGSKSN